MLNYKGLFYNDQKQKKYYEGGAHFKYKDLVKVLEELKEKQDEKENEDKAHNKNKSLDYNQNQDILINDNRHNILESTNKEKNRNYIEQLLNLNSVKSPKKTLIKLKEIKSVDKKKDIVLNTENNRYNNEMNKRNNSLELNKNLNLKNNTNDYKNLILLTENKNNSKNKESFSKPKMEIEYDLNKVDKKPDYLFYSHTKKLPKLNVESLSPISNKKQNINLDKNRQLFTINVKNKEESIYKNIMNNNGDNNENLYNNNNLRSIQLKKNSQRILRLKNEDNDKDKNKISIKSKLFSPIRKKSHRKKSNKYKSLDDE